MVRREHEERLRRLAVSLPARRGDSREEGEVMKCPRHAVRSVPMARGWACLAAALMATAALADTGVSAAQPGAGTGCRPLSMPDGDDTASVAYARVAGRCEIVVCAVERNHAYNTSVVVWQRVMPATRGDRDPARTRGSYCKLETMG